MLFFKKWITDNLLLSRNDLFDCINHGGLYFLTDNYNGLQNITLPNIVFDTCNFNSLLPFVLFQNVFRSKFKDFYFFDWLFNDHFGLSVHSLINAFLLFSSWSFIISRYSSPFLWSLLPALTLNNTFYLQLHQTDLVSFL